MAVMIVLKFVVMTDLECLQLGLGLHGFPDPPLVKVAVQLIFIETHILEITLLVCLLEIIMAALGCMLPRELCWYRIDPVL